MNKIRPFSRVVRADLVKLVSDLSPKLLGYPGASEGLRRASLRIMNKTIGMIDDNDCHLLAEPLESLADCAKETALCATAIIGYVTQVLDDYNEYELFGDICLPRRDGIHIERFGLWTDTLNTAIARHFNTTSLLKCKFRSAPRFRKAGADYCESMLISLCRIMIRPELRRFARRMEEISGWPSVERSGIPLAVHVAPTQPAATQSQYN